MKHASTALALAATFLLQPVLATEAKFSYGGGHPAPLAKRHGEALIPRESRQELMGERRRSRRSNRVKKRGSCRASGSSKKSPSTSSSDATASPTAVNAAAAVQNGKAKGHKFSSIATPSSSSSASSSPTAKKGSYSSSATSPSSSPTSGSSGPKKGSSSSAFTLAQDHSGSKFFDSWDFFNAEDPTHGAVNYVDGNTAWDQNLVEVTSSGTAKIKVDNKNKLAAGANRNSVRITSKERFDVGSLVLFDAKHIPVGGAVWPAMWSTTNNMAWPAGGEIDIVEQVNDVKQNQYTLHTTEGCTLSSSKNPTGTTLVSDCVGNIGCGVQDKSDVSYGSAFNNNGGGVYAMSWTESGIDFYFFPRNDLPADILAGAPTMEKWGNPSASYSSNTCDMAKYFSAQTLIINITLCGDWAGTESVFNAAGYSGTCSDYVTDPSHFDDAYWDINYVRVYTAN